MKPFAWLEKYLKEDNGSFSSARLITVFTICAIVPLFLILCLIFPHMKELTNAVLTFAGSIFGFKVGQKFGEKPPTE